MQAIDLKGSLKNPNITQQKIIKAALKCMVKWDVKKTSLSDIASEAGVTRATVYSYYPNKQDVFQAAFLHVATGFVERLIKHLTKFDEPTIRMIEAMTYICQQIPKDPYLGLITTPEMADHVNQRSLIAEEGIIARKALIKIILNGDTKFLPHIDYLSEVMTRMALSIIMVKPLKKKNTAELKQFFHQWVNPILENCS